MNDNYLQGLLLGLPNEEYHSKFPHISSSGFKLLEQSPLHYWSAYMDPERKRSEPSRIMVMGTAFHTGVFEPELFSTYAPKPDISPISNLWKLIEQAISMGDIEAFKEQHTAIPDGLTKTSKEGKQLLAELAEQGKTGVEKALLDKALEIAPGLIGKTLLAADDIAAVRSMAEAARNHPISQVIFAQEGGVAEASVFWIDDETGAPCRIRPDYTVPPCAMFPSGLIIDGKSNDDSSPEGFAKNCWNAQMYYQAAFYSDGMQHHWQTKEPPAFMWLCQERERPYATAYYAAGADIVEYGRKKYRKLLRVFAECMSTGHWPGYATTVQPLSLPGYASKLVQDEVAA